jgi:hypothetical protein
MLKFLDSRHVTPACQPPEWLIYGALAANGHLCALLVELWSSQTEYSALTKATRGDEETLSTNCQQPDMGVVLLSTPCSRISPSAAAPMRLTTESRVQHKAVKLMTKRRPKKVSTPRPTDHLVPEASLRRGSRRRSSTRRAYLAAPLTVWVVMPGALATMLGALSARRNAAWQRLRGAHPGL